MRKVLFLFFLIVDIVLAQEKNFNVKISDSIGSMKYVQLYQLFFENYKIDPDKAHMYASASIEKAKNENKEIFVAQGFALLSKLYEGDEIVLRYADSIIQWTKDYKSKEFPARGYLVKGNYFLKNKLFHKAFDNYKLANHFAMQKPNPRILYACNRSVGLLKSELGKHDEAIHLFRQSYRYASKEELKSKLEDILFLSKEFNKLNLLDSASYYNNIGIKETLKTKNENLYNLFVLNTGVTNYYKKIYQKTIDSICKILPDLEENNKTVDLVTSYFYLGKAYTAVKQKNVSIHYLIKMDSITQTSKDIVPEVLEGYGLLINHFEEKGNSGQKLFYSKKLFRSDSVLQSRQTDSLEKILKHYRTPLIVSSNYKIISELKDDKLNFKFAAIIVVVVFLIMIGGLIFLYKDRNQYQKSFKAVVAYTNKSSEGTEPTVKEEKNKKLTDLNISQETVDVILKGISNFENTNRYLNSKYSLSILAKELNTNSTYLSKIVNVYKGKNFSNYLHDLRIGYAIERLKDDRQFRLYSIKGISEEVGFKNSESFSKAFHKKTGIYPSDFIKKLKII